MLGEKIDERRRELKLSQKDLAARSGLSTQYVSSLIRGHRGSRLTLRAASGLGKALRVSQKFFQTESEDANSQSGKAK